MNNKIEKKDFEDYLEEARTWETDKIKSIDKALRIAYWYGGVASIVAIMASLASITMAFAWMNPAPPPVIRVDNSTGIVDVVKSIEGGKTNYDEIVNKYFTQWYVRYREGYSKELAEDYYTNVGIMSIGLEQQKYYEWFNPKNPLSPINIYGSYAKVKIGIKGTSFIKSNVALVRYTKSIERGLDKPQITHWAATITFKYSGAPMREKDREINPLGFQVVEYRNDPDAIAPEPTQPTASSPINSDPVTATPSNVTVFPGEISTPSALTEPAIKQ